MDNEDKRYSSFWLDEPFVIKAALRSRALGLIKSGSVLGAVRLLYDSGLKKPARRHFLEVEMDIPWHSTVFLDEWDPNVPDSDQPMIVKRMEASVKATAALRGEEMDLMLVDADWYILGDKDSMEKVASRLNAIEPDLNASVFSVGNGKLAVRVPVPETDRLIDFQPALGWWHGDLFDPNGERLESFATEIPTDCDDVSTVANGLYEAVTRYRPLATSSPDG